MNRKQINRYVGVPYKLNGRDMSGMDCYGLIIRVFKDVRGIDLPDWQTADDSSGAAMRILSKKIYESIEEELIIEALHPTDWCVVTVERAHVPHHIGLYINGGVLHSDHKFGTTFMPMDRFKMCYPYKLRFWKWLHW